MRRSGSVRGTMIGRSQRRAAEQFPELSIVTLRKPVMTEDGTIPAGSSGTIVHTYDDGRARLVEFFEPFHAVATVEVSAIGA